MRVTLGLLALLMINGCTDPKLVAANLDRMIKRCEELGGLPVTHYEAGENIFDRCDLPCRTPLPESR